LIPLTKDALTIACILVTKDNYEIEEKLIYLNQSDDRD